MNRFGQRIFRKKKSLKTTCRIYTCKKKDFPFPRYENSRVKLIHISSRLSLFRMKRQLAEIDPLLETFIPVCETRWALVIAGSLDDVILGSHSAIFRRDHLERARLESFPCGITSWFSLPTDCVWLCNARASRTYTIEKQKSRKSSLSSRRDHGARRFILPLSRDRRRSAIVIFRRVCGYGCAMTLLHSLHELA